MHLTVTAALLRKECEHITGVITVFLTKVLAKGK